MNLMGYPCMRLPSVKLRMLWMQWAMLMVMDDFGYLVPVDPHQIVISITGANHDELEQ